jgi:hypothetical protein
MIGWVRGSTGLAPMLVSITGERRGIPYNTDEMADFVPLLRSLPPYRTAFAAVLAARIRTPHDTPVAVIPDDVFDLYNAVHGAGSVSAEDYVRITQLNARNTAVLCYGFGIILTPEQCLLARLRFGLYGDENCFGSESCSVRGMLYLYDTAVSTPLSPAFAQLMVEHGRSSNVICCVVGPREPTYINEWRCLCYADHGKSMMTFWTCPGPRLDNRVYFTKQAGATQYYANIKEVFAACSGYPVTSTLFD